MTEEEGGEQQMCKVMEIGGECHKVFQVPECESILEHGLDKNGIYILLQTIPDGENVMPLPVMYLGMEGDGNTFCFLVVCEYVVDENSQANLRIDIARKDVVNTVFKPVEPIDLLKFPPVIHNSFERYLRYGSDDDFKVIPKDPGEIVEKMMPVE